MAQVAVTTGEMLNPAINNTLMYYVYTEWLKYIPTIQVCIMKPLLENDKLVCAHQGVVHLKSDKGKELLVDGNGVPLQLQNSQEKSLELDK